MFLFSLSVFIVSYLLLFIGKGSLHSDWVTCNFPTQSIVPPIIVHNSICTQHQGGGWLEEYNMCICSKSFLSPYQCLRLSFFPTLHHITRPTRHQSLGPGIPDAVFLIWSSTLQNSHPTHTTLVTVEARDVWLKNIFGSINLAKMIPKTKQDCQ